MTRSLNICLALCAAITVTLSCKRDSQTKHKPELSDMALPGAEPYEKQLAARLRSTLARQVDYKPRTRHLNDDGSPIYTNRLLFESSPYLRQHAHNPVNWYPWGDEAFHTAKQLGRPVLLSVGYSTCHWCHVMEEESFEDPKIAEFINSHYVAIKVDREERPDVDSIYMAAVTSMTGRGGWPMTVWLTPDRKPFYGGTYFPPYAGVRGSKIGFYDLLQQLHEAFGENPDGVAEAADQVVAKIRQMKTPTPGSAVTEADAASLLTSAAERYRRTFDPVNGGLSGSPKFPSSLPIRFLLRYYRRSGDTEFLNMAHATLDRMAAGGMYDHAGGGFHRYSVDERWLVPHFEKMLYDNALLTMAYLEGYQATGREQFADVAREILRYIARDMTSPDGAFYSATDADSKNPAGHTEEGYFFTWTPAELSAVLPAEQAKLAIAYFAVTETGNFEGGRTILSTPRALSDVAAELNIPLDDARRQVAAIKDTLYEQRKHRPPPLRDDKIMTAWNGLMISALARASRVLDTPADGGGADYLQRAERAARFVLDKLRHKSGLYRIYKDDRARIPAYLDDYAFFTAGLLDLFEATGNRRYIDEAIALDRTLEARFEDRMAGGFFLISDQHDPMLAREKPSYDGALPTGNSVAALNLLRLYEFTTRPEYLDRATRVFSGLASVLRRAPTAMSEMLLALDFWHDTAKQIVVIVPSTRDQARPFLDVLAHQFMPNAVLAVTSQESSALRSVVPLVKAKIAQRGEATAYVCERQRCELPTRDPNVFRDQIRKIQPIKAQ